MNSAAKKHKPSCPCCLFATDDLFLPPPQREADEQHDAGEDAPMSPLQCWESLLESVGQDPNVPVVVDTHGHAHLDRNDSVELYQLLSSSPQASNVVSLTCAVEPADWSHCLEYVAASSHRVAALGVHPWYLADLDETWLQDLESLIKQHAGCMVGEIGLCKMARIVRNYPAGKQAALALQRNVFVQQLRLAAAYQRPVSVHCVNQQGVLFEILKQEQSNLPPAIALHSFSGTAHHIKQLLEWENSLQLQHPLLYFGFSHTVNHVMCTSDKSRRQGREAVRQVPSNRLLAESDVHCHAHVALGTAGAVAYLAWALDESVLTIADCTRRNGLRFLQIMQVETVAAK